MRPGLRDKFPFFFLIILDSPSTGSLVSGGRVVKGAGSESGVLGSIPARDCFCVSEMPLNRRDLNHPRYTNLLQLGNSNLILIT